jgi:hypothetical protein
MPNSNAIATLTIQDQDLITPGLANLVNRVNATVTFPSSGGTFYGGYATVNAGSSFVIVGPAVVSPFVYVRNITANANVLLALSYQQSGSGVAAVVNLCSGGIFLYGNALTVGTGLNGTGLQNVFFSPLGTGNIATVEYFWAN